MRRILGLLAVSSFRPWQRLRALDNREHLGETHWRRFTRGSWLCRAVRQMSRRERSRATSIVGACRVGKRQLRNWGRYGATAHAGDLCPP